MSSQLILLLFVIVPPTLGQADVVEYNTEDRDQWFADATALGDITTIGFTEYPFNTTITDHYDHVGVNFEGLNFVTLDAPSFHDDWGIRIFSGNHLYFDEPINWIAADFLGTLRIDIYENGEIIHTSGLLGHSGLGQFGGLISYEGFTHIRIIDWSDPLAVLDDLHFGPIIAVPAPGALAVIGLALMSRRRRLRSA